jgi:tetratricopeptide (TPR) repeat protein
VLAELGRLHAFADERILAAEEGRQALALAEQLGLDGLRASALNTLGVVHFFEGDLAGAEALYQQVTEIESPSAALEVGRALTNLSVLSSLEGDMAEVELRYRRALEHATRIGNQNQLRWLEGYPAIRAYAEGRWDEALAHAEAFLANARRLGGHYHEHNTRIHRGLILAHRGDADGARRDLEHVLGTLGESSDLQLVMPALFAGTTIEVLSGHQARANELLDAAAESWRSGSARLLLVGSTDALAAIVRLGRAAEWLGLLGSGGDTRRMRNARLLLSGDWVAAADEVAYIDGPTGEAAFRLVAAEQLAAMGRAAEARAQLERALAFYRAVGAKHVVRHAEALLPQSA